MVKSIAYKEQSELRMYFLPCIVPREDHRNKTFEMLDDLDESAMFFSPGDQHKIVQCPDILKVVERP